MRLTYIAVILADMTLGGAVVGVLLTMGWQRECIRRGVAEYDDNGKFQWTVEKKAEANEGGD